MNKIDYYIHPDFHVLRGKFTEDDVPHEVFFQFAAPGGGSTFPGKTGGPSNTIASISIKNLKTNMSTPQINMKAEMETFFADHGGVPEGYTIGGAVADTTKGESAVLSGDTNPVADPNDDGQTIK